MGRVFRRLSLALLIVGAIALIFLAADVLEGVVDALVERVGALPALAVVAGATLLLAAAWLRYGGARVLRRWGVVILPRSRTARRKD